MPLLQKIPPKETKAHIGEYSLMSKFSGYHAREDQTTLPPSIMVSPSQNVLIGTSGRISQVKGYVLDGQGGGTFTLGTELITNGSFTGGTTGWAAQNS